METIIKRIKASVATATLCILGASSGWAATPVAVWDGDSPLYNFSTLARRNGAITYTLASNSQHDTKTDTYIQLATANQEAAPTITANSGASNPFGNGGCTIILKCENMPVSSGSNRALITLYNSDKTSMIGIKNNNTTGGFIGNGTNIGDTQANVFSSSKMTVAMTYSTSSGTCYYTNGAVVATYSGLKYSYFTSPTGVSIGGLPVSGSGTFYGMRQMKILGVAVFTSALSASEIAAYTFPSESVTSTLTASAGSSETGSNLADLTWSSEWPNDASGVSAVLNVTDDTSISLGSVSALGRITFNVAEGKTLTLTGSSTMSVSDGIVVNGGKVAVSSASLLSGSFAGDGTVIYTAKPTLTSSGIDVTKDAWGGVLWFTNVAVDATIPANCASAKSTLRLTGCTGYFNDGGNTSTCLGTLDLVDAEDGTAALTVNNGWSDSGVSKFAKLTGAGTFKSDTATYQKYVFIDPSEFAGSFNLPNGKYTRVILGDSTYSLGYGSVTITNATATIAAGKTWTLVNDGYNNDIHVYNGGVLNVNGTISGATRVNKGGTVNVSASESSEFTVNSGGVVNTTGDIGLSSTSNYIAEGGNLNVETGTLTLTTSTGNGASKGICGTVTVKSGATLKAGVNDQPNYDRNKGMINVYGTLNMNGKRWTLNSNIAFNVYAGGVITGDGDTTGYALDFNTSGGGVIHAMGDSGTATVSAPIRCNGGANAKFQVDEGMTLTISGALYGNYSVNKYGDGVLKFARAGTGTSQMPVVQEGAVQIADGWTYLMSGRRDFSGISIVDSATPTITITQSLAEYGCGTTTVTGLNSSITSVTVNKYNGTTDVILNDGSATSASLSETPVVYGKACWYDFTFTNTITTAGGSSAGNVTLGKDAGPAYGDLTDQKSNTYRGIKSYCRPYSGINLGSKSQFAVALFGTMPSGNNTILLDFGSGRDGGALFLASGTSDNEAVLYYYTTGKVLKQLKTMSATSARTVPHLYVFQKVNDHQVDIYLDGKLALSYVDNDITFTLTSGFQIASAYSAVPTGLNAVSQTATSEPSIIAMTRVYDRNLTQTEINKLKTDWPYYSPNGTFTRTLASEETAADWSETGKWLDDSSEAADVPTANSNAEFSNGSGATATLSVNLASDTAYESVTFGGANAITVELKSGNTGKLVPAATTADTDVTLAYNAVNLLTGPTAVAANKTLTIDVSSIVSANSSWQYAASVAPIQLTGVVTLGEGASVAVSPATAGNWNLSVSADGGGNYWLNLSPNRETGDIYWKSGTYWSDGNDCTAAFYTANDTEESHKTQYFSGDTVIVPDATTRYFGTVSDGATIKFDCSGEITLMKTDALGYALKNAAVTVAEGTTLSLAKQTWGSAVNPEIYGGTISGAGKVKVASGVTATLSNGATISTSTALTGAGEFVLASAQNAQMAFDNWTGTVTVPSFVAGGQQLNYYGNANSKVKINGITSGWLNFGDGSAAYNVNPEIILAGDFVLTDMSTRTVNFSKVSGSGNMSLTKSSSGYSLTVTISELTSYNGTVINNMDTTITVSTLALASDATVTAGTLLLATGGSGNFAITSTTVGGVAASFTPVKGTGGFYVPVATWNDTPFGTISDAIAAAEAAEGGSVQDIVVSIANPPNVPNGYEIVATGDNTWKVMDNRTSTWTNGSGDKAWNNAANWSSGRVPSQYTTVTIPASESKWEIKITDASGTDKCGALVVNGNAKFIRSGGEWVYLTLYGNITGEGTLTLYQASLKTGAASEISCNLVFPSATYDSFFGGNSNWTISGAITLESGAYWKSGDSRTVTVTGPLTINGGKIESGSAITVTGPITINASFTKAGNSALTFNGPVTIADGVAYTLPTGVTYGSDVSFILASTTSSLTVPESLTESITADKISAGVEGASVTSSGETDKTYTIAAVASITVEETTTTYGTLQDAVDHVDDGGTITILADCGDVAVSGAKTFTISNTGGYTLGTIAAATAEYELTDNGSGSYTVAYKSTKYYWAPTANTTSNWTDIENWHVTTRDGATATRYPTEVDDVKLAQNATVVLNVDASVKYLGCENWYHAHIVNYTETQRTFSIVGGAGNYSFAVEGSGTATIDGNIKVVAANLYSYGTFTIGKDVEFTVPSLSGSNDAAVRKGTTDLYGTMEIGKNSQGRWLYVGNSDAATVFNIHTNAEFMSYTTVVVDRGTKDNAYYPATMVVGEIHSDIYASGPNVIIDSGKELQIGRNTGSDSLLEIKSGKVTAETVKLALASTSTGTVHMVGGEAVFKYLNVAKENSNYNTMLGVIQMDGGELTATGAAEFGNNDKDHNPITYGLSHSELISNGGSLFVTNSSNNAKLWLSNNSKYVINGGYVKANETILRGTMTIEVGSEVKAADNAVTTGALKFGNSDTESVTATVNVASSLAAGTYTLMSGNSLTLYSGSTITLGTRPNDGKTYAINADEISTDKALILTVSDNVPQCPACLSEAIPIGFASGEVTNFVPYVTAHVNTSIDSGAYSHTDSENGKFYTLATQNEGATFSFKFDNTTAGDYVLSFLTGMGSGTAAATVTVTGDNYSAQLAGFTLKDTNWNATDKHIVALAGLPVGTFTVTVTCLTTENTQYSYYGNFTDFTLKSLASIAVPFEEQSLNVGDAITAGSLIVAGDASKDTTTGNGDYAVGNVKSSSTFTIILNIATAKEYKFSYKSGNASNSSTVNWKLTPFNSVTSTWTATDTIVDDDSWVCNTLHEHGDISIATPGLYKLEFSVASIPSGTYAGNFGFFAFKAQNYIPGEDTGVVYETEEAASTAAAAITSANITYPDEVSSVLTTDEKKNAYKALFGGKAVASTTQEGKYVVMIDFTADAKTDLASALTDEFADVNLANIGTTGGSVSIESPVAGLYYGVLYSADPANVTTLYGTRQLSNGSALNLALPSGDGTVQFYKLQVSTTAD